MKQPPDNEGKHDPGKDPFGTWRRWRCGSGHIEEGYAHGPSCHHLAKNLPEKKGPRNGPDPRGAGKLNRFRERLDGDVANYQIELEATAGIRAAA